MPQKSRETASNEIKPKTRKILFLFLLLLLVGTTLYADATIASRKLFWIDEGNELLLTCSQTLTNILSTGAAGQCSPNPFYYFFERAFVNLLPWQIGGPLIVFRLLSLLSAAATIGFVFLWLSRSFGMMGGVFGTFTMLGDAIFHEYAAENRPYMFWLALFALYFAAATSVLSGKRGTLNWILLTAFSLGLTAVAGGGTLQSAAGLLLIALFLYRENKKTSIYPIALMFVCIALGFYYSRHSCGWWPGPNNLWETKNPRLVAAVWRVLFPPGAFNWILNGLIFLAVVSSLGTTRGFLKRSPTPTRLQAISLLLVTQLAATIAIALLVVVKGYFFTPRIFIFLLTLRAIGAALGLSMAFRNLSDKKYWRAPAYAYQAAFVIFNLHGLSASVNRFEPLAGENPNPEFCEGLNSRRITLYAGSAAVEPEIYSNALLRFMRRANACPLPAPAASKEMAYAVLIADPHPDGKIDFMLQDHPAQGKEIIQQCGRPTVLEPPFRIFEN